MVTAVFFILKCLGLIKVSWDYIWGAIVVDILFDNDVAEIFHNNL